MKKLIFLLIVLIFLQGFSQEKEINYLEDSNPNSKNELSLYLKENISKKFLKNIRYPRYTEKIVLSFNISKENKPVRISISNFGNSKAYNAIKGAFENYPLEKLGLQELSRKNRYFLQIISKENSKNIFNASSKILVETPIISNNCKDLTYYEDLETCFKEEVKKHMYAVLDFSILTKETETLFIQFNINKNGKLVDNKSKVPSYFLEELNKALNSFNKINSIATINNELVEESYSFSIAINSDEKPVYKDLFSIAKKLAKPTTDNSFSTYLAKNLSKEFIDKADLNRINNSLYLSFELDNKKKPTNLTSNSRSEALEKVLFNLLKKYDVESFNFSDTSKFNRHSIQILSFEEGKTIINTSTSLTSERYIVFPGCETSKDIKELRNCFNKGVQQHFIKEFNASLPNQLGLSKGRKRIFIGFKIDTNGSVTDVKVRAPHVAIMREVKRVLFNLPKVSPGRQRGENINVSYNIPFTILVD